MTSPNTAFSTQVLTSAQMNNLPFGVCGLQTLTSVFTTSATHTTLQPNGMTLTITEVVGRRYKITVLSNPYPSGGLQGVSFEIVRGATGIKRGIFSSVVMDAGTALPIVLTFVYTSVGSGSATYSVNFAAVTSNTAVSDYGDATFPRQFIIEDIGAS